MREAWLATRIPKTFEVDALGSEFAKSDSRRDGGAHSSAREVTACRRLRGDNSLKFQKKSARHRIVMQVEW